MNCDLPLHNFQVDLTSVPIYIHCKYSCYRKCDVTCDFLSSKNAARINQTNLQCSSPADPFQTKCPHPTHRPASPYSARLLQVNYFPMQTIISQTQSR